MAKSKSFYGLRKGSTKTLTFSVLKGQQITKDRVTDVTNPKTQSQMIQRMLFAQVIKFYKQALANFFRFAFEDKRQTESDYNAFVRHNTTRAIAVDYDNYKNAAYPSLGNFQLTQGSLLSPEAEWDDTDDTFILYCDATDQVTTIGALSSAILSYYPTLAQGDIITVAHTVSALDDDAELAEDVAPSWIVRQFVLDPSDTRDCRAVLGDSYQSEDGYVSLFKKVENRLQMCSVTFSRNTPSGLKVSDSFMIPSQGTWYFIQSMETDAAKRQCVISWGAGDKAILQGGLTEEPADTIYKATIQGGRYVENATSSEKVVGISWSPSTPNLKDTDAIRINGTDIPYLGGGSWYHESSRMGLKKEGMLLSLIVGPNRSRTYVREMSINGKDVQLY